MTIETWRARAKCRLDAKEPSFFFPDADDHRAINAAIAYCSNCPVKSDCQTRALENEERHGIWGGSLITDVRAAQKKQSYKPKTLQPHGTWQRYRQHHRAGEISCGPCLAAWNEHVQESKARSRARLRHEEALR